MKLRIYNKRGNHNFREKRFVKEITERLTQQAQSDPKVLENITPANTFEELEVWHKRVTAESVDFVEVDTPKTETPEQTPEQTPETKPDMAENENKPFIDPFNRQEPNVREYVLKDQFSPDGDANNKIKSSYGEPINFDEAFGLPSDDDIAQPQRPTRGGSSQSSGGGSSSKGNSDMDPARAKRMSKRLAKQIVDITCACLEFGFVWYCTKDITQEKMQEYEDAGIDVDFLLEMPDGMRVSVREYFMNQIGAITEASKFDKEDRDDMVDDLTEYFVENDIKMSTGWNCVLTAVTIGAKKILSAVSITASNNMVIAQLPRRGTPEAEKFMRYENPPEPQPQYTPPVAPTNTNVSEYTPSLQREIEADLELLKEYETKE